MHRRLKKYVIIPLVVAGSILLGAAECEDGSGTAADTENKSRLSTYERLVKNQPAQSMDYSPTRATKNFWIETWDEPGKLSYVYLQSSTGDLLGYYVLEGLPVSYCTSLIPPYEVKDYTSSSGGNALAVPGPSVDGTYSSGSNCNTYYGKDATTGAYVEYTAGLGINVLLYDQPLPRNQNVQPLGPTAVEDVKR